MTLLILVLKITLFLVIVNVWVFRFKKSTPYRGGQATTMTEEFTSYNLPAFMLYVVGALKILAATTLLLSLFSENEIINDTVKGFSHVFVNGWSNFHAH